VARDGKSAAIEIDPPRRDAVEKIVVHLENFGRLVKSVKLDNKELRDTTVKIPTAGSFALEIELQN
jgi:hypothetical protein